MDAIGQHLTDDNAHLPYCGTCLRICEPYPTTGDAILSGCCDSEVRVDSFSHARMDSYHFEIWLEASDE